MRAFVIGASELHEMRRAPPPYLHNRFQRRRSATRATLAWTEAITLIINGHVPEPLYEEVCSHLSERELAEPTLAIATINAWNRLSISACLVPGAYQPAKRPEAMKET